jgi:Flp pilus assembly pilin Flp
MKNKILDQKGQGLTEYITLLLLISVTSIAVTKTLGTVIRDKIKEAHKQINSIVIKDERGGGGPLGRGGLLGGGGSD